MRRTTEDQSRGIRWTLFWTLEDLDFADDLVLLSHTHQHMQEKTNRLNTHALEVDLKISQTKTEVMLLNFSNPKAVQVNGEDLPTTEEFTYLDSAVRHNGGAGSDIKAEKCLQNTQQRVEVLSIQHQDQLKIYQSCVTSSLLYGSECWRMTDSVITKLSVFHTKNHRRILQIFWPDTISNIQLLARCNQDSMLTVNMRGRWRWIGHIMRREQDNITRTALY